MIINIHPDNPQPRLIEQVVEILRNDGVIIYPTDTVYGLGCDVNSKKAIEQVARIKHMNVKKAEFSIICNNLSEVSDYTYPLPNQVFRTMKSVLPGPYTFILNANNHLPTTFRKNKKTIGIRIPDNKIALQIAEVLGRPIISTSMNKFEDDIREYYTNPELIAERYEHIVDAVIDGGTGGLEPSTVVDATSLPMTIIREGKGPIDDIVG